MSRVALALCVLGVSASACGSTPNTPEPPMRPVEGSDAYLGLVRHRLGSATFGFSVPPSARRIELEFAQPLRGANVDVDAFAAGRTFPLLRDRRVSDTRVTVDWKEADLERIEVTVHQHLRERPVVRNWQLWGSL